MKITDKYVFFWKEEPFCNFTKCKIRIDYNFESYDFTSSEQLFMWYKAKFFGDEETAEKILKSTRPEEARRLGRTVKNYDDKTWDIYQARVFEICKIQKFNHIIWYHPSQAINPYKLPSTN